VATGAGPRVDGTPTANVVAPLIQYLEAHYSTEWIQLGNGIALLQVASGFWAVFVFLA
jgi:hypothetical protein